MGEVFGGFDYVGFGMLVLFGSARFGSVCCGLTGFGCFVELGTALVSVCFGFGLMWVWCWFGVGPACLGLISVSGWVLNRVGFGFGSVWFEWFRTSVVEIRFGLDWCWVFFGLGSVCFTRFGTGSVSDC